MTFFLFFRGVPPQQNMSLFLVLGWVVPSPAYYPLGGYQTTPMSPMELSTSNTYEKAVYTFRLRLLFLIQIVLMEAMVQRTVPLLLLVAIRVITLTIVAKRPLLLLTEWSQHGNTGVTVVSLSISLIRIGL